MDIAGYDSWRLSGPEDGPTFELSEYELEEAAENYAEELLDDDHEQVEYILEQDSSWVIVAIEVAAGTKTALELETTIRGLVVAYLIEHESDKLSEMTLDVDPF
jgi:hypothetical protein